MDFDAIITEAKRDALDRLESGYLSAGDVAAIVRCPAGDRSHLERAAEAVRRMLDKCRGKASKMTAAQVQAECAREIAWQACKLLGVEIAFALAGGRAEA